MNLLLLLQSLLRVLPLPINTRWKRKNDGAERPNGRRRREQRRNSVVWRDRRGTQALTPEGEENTPAPAQDRLAPVLGNEEIMMTVTLDVEADHRRHHLIVTSTKYHQGSMMIYPGKRKGSGTVVNGMPTREETSRVLDGDESDLVCLSVYG